MIEGSILLAELGLFLVLLLKVWRVHAKTSDEGTGFFAYRQERQTPQAVDKGVSRPGGAPRA